MDRILECLEDHASTNAHLRFSVDRDETDSYDLKLERYPCGEHGPLSSLEMPDLMNLLPAGTSFRKVVGWRDIFGSQFQCGDVSMVVIGVEEVVPHPTRGAYPRSNIYLYPNIRAAAGGLVVMANELPKPASNAWERRHIYASDSVTPEEHRFQEASTLACAISNWKYGARLLFRTLLVDESTLRLPGHPGPPFRLSLKRGGMYKFDSWLICTTAAVRDECGAVAKGWMRLQKWN